MKFNPAIFFPPGIVIEDESVVYRRALRQNLERQAERDMMTQAGYDNMAHGSEYQSIFETQPELLDGLDEATRKRIVDELKNMKRPRYDASRGGLCSS